MPNNRRTLLKTAVAGLAAAGAAQAQTGPTKKVHYRGKKPEKTPLFSSAVSYGNLLFIAGKGAHVPGDILSHTKIVLDDIQAELENAGSSMDKVLKVSVFLNDLKDWQPDRHNKLLAGGDVFGGRPTVTIPPGAVIYSDALDMNVPAMGDLAIDLDAGLGDPVIHDKAENQVHTRVGDA